MGAVGVMLNQGVEKIRDSLVTYSKQFDPSVDTTELEEASATFTARWKDYNIAVKNGADITAWNTLVSTPYFNKLMTFGQGPQVYIS